MELRKGSQVKLANDIKQSTQSRQLLALKGEWYTSTKNVASSAFIQFEKYFDECLITTNFGEAVKERLTQHADIVYIDYLFPGYSVNTLIGWNDAGFDNPNQKHYQLPGSGLVIEVHPTVH